MALDTNDLQGPRKLLIGDFAPLKFEQAISRWEAQELRCETVTESEEFIAKLKTGFYDVCIVNLLLGGIGPNKLIADVREASKNQNIKVVVVSRQVQRVNIENAVNAGADDFVAEPFEIEDVFNRIMYHLSPKTVVQNVATSVSGGESAEKQYINLLLESVEALSRTHRHQAHQGILEVLQKVANLLESNRTSLIMAHGEGNAGMVLASSDDPSFQDFPINLSKYPEVQHVMNTGTIVLIEDVNNNSMTKKIKDEVKSIAIGSMMVFPVRFQSDVVGGLVIRRPKARELPSRDVLSVIQSLANILASHSKVKMMLRKIYSDFKATS